MAAPETRIDLPGSQALLLGTVAGHVPDGARVTGAIDRHRPTDIAVGVPPEDIEALRSLTDDPSLADDLPELDGLDALFVEHLRRFGEVQVVPSPDLAAVHESGLPLHAIDMPDDVHTDLYTRTMKIRHLVQRASAHRRIEKATFEEAKDAYALASQWESLLARVKPLARLERERASHMAQRIQGLAAATPRLLAVVPAALFDTVNEALDAAARASVP